MHRAGRGSAAAEVGLQRLSFVRVDAGSAPLRCEAVGVAHHHPAVVSVSVDAAAALVRAGVPLVVHGRDGRVRAC